MPKLPSERQLLEMSEIDRHFTIERHWRDLNEEFQGIQSGYVVPWNRSTKTQLVRSARRRMAHLQRVASELGIELPAFEAA